MAESDKVDAKRCNTNHLILAALGATFATTVIITVISLALSPAHISFSITHASSKVNGDKIDLMFIVAARNPSRRCKARYQSVFVDLKNSSASTSAVGGSYIHATINNRTVFPTDYIKGPNVTLINAAAILVASADTTKANSFETGRNSTGLTAVVTALVHFKVGVFRTRLFEIKVFCPGVLFLDEGSNSTMQLGNFNCSG